MLRSISIKGRPGLRGIQDLSINFNYPLTVISGKNGCGKTTALALAALGFHSPASAAELLEGLGAIRDVHGVGYQLGRYRMCSRPSLCEAAVGVKCFYPR